MSYSLLEKRSFSDSKNKANNIKLNITFIGSIVLKVSNLINSIEFEGIVYKRLKNICLFSLSNMSISLNIKLTKESSSLDISPEIFFSNVEENLFPFVNNKFINSQISERHFNILKSCHIFKEIDHKILISGEWSSKSSSMSLIMINYLLTIKEKVLLIDFNSSQPLFTLSGFIYISILDKALFTNDYTNLILDESKLLHKLFLGGLFAKSYSQSIEIIKFMLNQVDKILSENDNLAVVVNMPWKRNFISEKINDNIKSFFTLYDFMDIKADGNINSLVFKKAPLYDTSRLFLLLQSVCEFKGEKVIQNIFSISMNYKQISFDNEIVKMFIKTENEKYEISKTSQQKLLVLGKYVECQLIYKDKESQASGFITKINSNNIFIRFFFNSTIIKEPKLVIIDLYSEMDQKFPLKLFLNDQKNKILPYCGFRLKGFGAKNNRRRLNSIHKKD